MEVQIPIIEAGKVSPSPKGYPFNRGDTIYRRIIWAFSSGPGEVIPIEGGVPIIEV